MIKKILISLAVIIVIYAFLPTNIIDFISKFALGWMIVDIVTLFIED
jgi:hypothetical protein